MSKTRFGYTVFALILKCNSKSLVLEKKVFIMFLIIYLFKIVVVKRNVESNLNDVI